MKHFNRLFIASAMAFSLVLSLAACGSGGNNGSSGNDGADGELKIVRIGLASSENSPSGVFAAADRIGYVDEELSKVGYKVEWVAFAAAGPAVNEALIGGSIDIAYYGNLPPVNLKSKNVDVEIIAFPDADLHFAVLKQKGADDIQTVKDLEGKKVLVGKGTVYDEYWNALVDLYGIDTSKVEVINDPANANNIFANGEADAVITVQGVELILAGQGVEFETLKHTLYSHSELASQVVLVGRREYLREDEEAAVALLTAYIKAYDYLLANPNKIPELVSSAGNPQTVIEKLLEQYPGYISDKHGEPTETAIQRLQKVAEFLAAYGYIYETYDVNSLVNAEYYEKAVKAAREN